jgi:hypothetical protein
VLGLVGSWAANVISALARGWLLRPSFDPAPSSSLVGDAEPVQKLGAVFGVDPVQLAPCLT